MLAILIGCNNLLYLSNQYRMLSNKLLIVIGCLIVIVVINKLNYIVSNIVELKYKI